tara:strand:- start:10009 stop:11607 length:1599 start_codon:yes stop_codon:yes gene_type:complete
VAKPRKTFVKTDVPEEITGEVGNTEWDLSVPANTVVNVGYNFDFGPWYHKGIDEIVSACQQQISHWVITRDGDYSVKTLNSCCYNGINHFLDFMVVLRNTLESDITFNNFNKNTNELFIQYLGQSDTDRTTQYNRYTHSKIVLRGLLQRNIIKQPNIFPKNPFPNANRRKKGALPLSSKERNELSSALRKELKQLASDNDDPLDGFVLTCCLLAIALRTGRNTSPLLEMKTDCLRDHPLKENRKLLVVFKRRGGKSHVVSLRTPEEIETITTILPDVVTIIDQVIAKTDALRKKVNEEQRQNVWLYPSARRKDYGVITSLNDLTICQNIKRLIDKYSLQDTDGKSMEINVSRLRATFINRLWKLSGNDPIITAKLGGHTLKVSNDHYLQATPEMQRDHKFMGDVLVQELMTNTLGSHADNTPVGKCGDPLNGDRAPKNGQHCTDFLSCFRCRSCVITGDDLYRLFSFYWLIIKERNEIGTRHWGKVYGHIIRIIDRQIAPQFPSEQVEAARQRAKNAPHPFWCNRELLEASA